jgi:protein-L-isoaspartate(D-aspartate) O-methyltransferase
MEESFKLKGLRERLISDLRRKGISNEAVLEAMLVVKRHLFVESAFAEISYNDYAMPIAEQQTISQPYTVAYQTELLGIQPGDKVLEIGTGSGYQCAILCQLSATVYSIERNPQLFEAAKALLTEMGYKPTLKLGDGSLGWASASPFKGILVTAAAPSVPEALLQQLAIGGRLVIPVGEKEFQQMMRITKETDADFSYEQFERFRFVPLIGKQGWDETAG